MLFLIFSLTQLNAQTPDQIKTHRDSFVLEKDTSVEVMWYPVLKNLFLIDPGKASTDSASAFKDYLKNGVFYSFIVRKNDRIMTSVDLQTIDSKLYFVETTVTENMKKSVTKKTGYGVGMSKLPLFEDMEVLDKYRGYKNVMLFGEIWDVERYDNIKANFIALVKSGKLVNYTYGR